MTDSRNASRMPHELASPDMEHRIGEAANEQSIVLGALLHLTGHGAELCGEVYDMVLRSVEKRHLLPVGSGRIVMQRCIDDWRDNVDMLKSFFSHHDTDVE